MAGSYVIRQDWGQRNSVYVNDMAMGLAVTDATRATDEANALLSTLWRTDSHATWKRGKDQVRAYQPPAAGALSLTLSNTGALSAAGNGLQRGRLVRFALKDNLAVGTLGAAISDTTGTTVTMTGGHSVAQWDYVTIDSETLYVTAVSVNTLTVQRGALVTTPATHSNGATVTRVNERAMATGILDSTMHVPDIGFQQVTIPCLGTLSRLVGATPISTLLYSSITVDQAIRYVLNAAGWPDGDLILDTSNVTLLYWWLTNVDPWTALTQLLATEGPGGELYEDARGRIVFKARGRKFSDTASTTSQATFYGTSTLPNFTTPFGYDDGQKDVVNIALVPLDTRTLAAVGVIWTYGQDLVLAPNETRTVIASLTNPATNIQNPIAGTDYNTSLGYLAAYSLAAGQPVAQTGPAVLQVSGQVVKIGFTAGPLGATITGLQLQGQALTSSSSSYVTNGIDTRVSQGKYGQRLFTASTWPVVSVDTAQSLADWIVFWNRNGRPVVQLATQSGQDGTVRTQQITREIGDRITVVETNMPINADYWIESIQGDAGATHKITFGCEKAIGGLGIDYKYGSTQQYNNNGGTLAFNDGTLAAVANDGLISQVTNGSGADAVTYWLQCLLPAATYVPAGKKVTGMRARVRCYDPTSVTNTAATVCGTGADLGSFPGYPGAQMTLTWANPTRVNAVDASSATATTATSGFTTALTGKNFSFAVPSNATIIGIYPEILAKGTASATQYEVIPGKVNVLSTVDAVTGLTSYSNVYGPMWSGLTYNSLQLGGIIGSTVQGCPIVSPAGGGSYYTLPSTLAWIPGTYLTNNLYSANLTPSIVNDPTFGVFFEVGIVNDTVSVDAIRCTIYYRIGSTLYEARAVARGIQSVANKAGGAIAPVSMGYLYFGGPTETFGGILTAASVNNAAGYGAVVAFTVPNGNTLYVDEIVVQTFYDDDVTDTTSYFDTVIADTPAGFWRLDDTGATAYDSVRVANGTYAGNYIHGIAAPPIDGSAGTYFDGGAVSVSLGDNYDQINTTAFSVEALVYLDPNYVAVGSTFNILNKTDATNGWQFAVFATGTIGQVLFRRFAAGGAGFETALSAGTLRTGRWYHVMATFDGTTMTVYVNGVAGTGVASSRNLTNNAFNCYIGRNNGGTAWANGAIKDVVIYTGTRTAAQVLAHYQASHVATAVLDTYEAAVTTDAPVGWWKLGETSGTTATDSGSGGHNGTYTNAPILGRPGMLGGEERAIQLDGAANYVDCGDFNDFNGVTAFSVECWIRPDAAAIAAASAALAYKIDAGPDGWSLMLSAGVPLFQRDVAGAAINASGSILMANQPYHLVGTYDGANSRLYVNGVLVATSGADARSIANTAVSLCIGRSQTFGVYYAGLIQEVAVYSGALSAARVLAHYNSAAGA